MANTLRKAVFLDRDGVINEKREDYVKDVSEFILLKDTADAIRFLNKNNYLVIIITNQSVINRGIISVEELERIHNYMRSELKGNGAFIDAIYYCPHKPDENCLCRKPETELIKRALKDFSISLESSWMIGDSKSDIEAADKEGIHSLLMKTNSSLFECIKLIPSLNF